MSRVITFRVPDERVVQLDRLVATGQFPTRAAALNAALDRLVADAAEREIDRQIVEGYTRIPPTAEEEAWAEISGRRSIADEPW